MEKSRTGEHCWYSWVEARSSKAFNRGLLSVQITGKFYKANPRVTFKPIQKGRLILLLVSRHLADRLEVRACQTLKRGKKCFSDRALLCDLQTWRKSHDHVYHLPICSGTSIMQTPLGPYQTLLIIQVCPLFGGWFKASIVSQATPLVFWCCKSTIFTMMHMELIC